MTHSENPKEKSSNVRTIRSTNKDIKQKQSTTMLTRNSSQVISNDSLISFGVRHSNSKKTSTEHSSSKRHSVRHGEHSNHHCIRRHNSPNEASISWFDTESLDPEKQILNEEIVKEYCNDNIAKLAKTEYDPERFLKPSKHEHIQYLEREVNPNKILQYLIDYMDEYYNITNDANPYSKWREQIDEKLWDNFAYVIPLLCNQVIHECFSQEETIITLGPDVIVFGDIHGNLNDIHYIHKNFLNVKKYANFKFIFLGDYVDRGPKSLEVLLFLFAIKLNSPKRFILLRGNHEVIKVNRKYGFKSMIDHLYRDTYIKNKNLLHRWIYTSINEVFKHLPLGAVVKFKDKKGIFCCHGGIPNESFNRNQPWTIDQLKRLHVSYKPHDLVPRKNCSPEQSALNELLWNDPISHSFFRHHHGSIKLFYPNIRRGGHCSKFSEEAVNRFLSINNLRLIIRGHQFQCSKEKGYHYHFSNQTLTVFSSSNYCGTENNTTGFVMITNESCDPMVLRTAEESRHYQRFNHFELIIDKTTKEVTDVIF